RGARHEAGRVAPARGPVSHARSARSRGVHTAAPCASRRRTYPPTVAGRPGGPRRKGRSGIMFHAFGHGAGFGFGLGFLNLIGTVRFTLLIVYLVKSFARGTWRGRGPYGEPGWRPGWWGGPPGRWSHQGEPGGDEATRIARDRLASGEITPSEYEAIKRGL